MSSAIFENLRQLSEMAGKCSYTGFRVAFGLLFEHSGRKSSENRQKRRY